MVLVPVKCPFCESGDVVKYGKNAKGKQLYLCRNKECAHTKFPEECTYNACKPETKEKIYSLAVNGNGTRAIGRILDISTNTVASALKKKKIAYHK